MFPIYSFFYSSVYFRRIKMAKISWAIGGCVRIHEQQASVKVEERACTLLKSNRD